MNRRIPNFLSVIVLFGCIFFLQSAYGQPPTSSEQPAPSAGQTPPPAEQQPPAPPSVDKDLMFLLGKWETKIKIFPNGLLGNKEEVKGGGTAEYKAFGKVVEGIRTSDTSRGHFEDREFLWYDQNTKAYNIISINSEGHSANKKMTKVGDQYVVEYSGRAKGSSAEDGDKAGSQGERDFTVRAKFKIESDKEVKYSSELKFGKADFVPFFQLKMKRTSE